MNILQKVIDNRKIKKCHSNTLNGDTELLRLYKAKLI